MHEINLQNLTIEGLKFENKRSYIYSNSTGSAFIPPVRPVHSTGQTGVHGCTTYSPVRPVHRPVPTKLTGCTPCPTVSNLTNL